jgi:hypothetical protein
MITLEFGIIAIKEKYLKEIGKMRMKLRHIKVI